MSATATFVILASIYLVSLLITGAIHWARYKDESKHGKEIPMEQKVMYLYVVPFCPVINSFIAFSIIGTYMDSHNS